MKTKEYTPEIVWATLDKVAEQQVETWRLMQENQRSIKELRESQAKTDQKIDKVTENVNKLEIASSKTDQQIDKLTESHKATELLIKEHTKNVHHLNDDIGGMQNSTGFFAEQYFFNCFKKGNRTFFGEHFDAIKKNVLGGKPRTAFHDEYDIVLYNCKTIAIIETKFRARTFHVDDTIDKVKTFRMNFPNYSGHQFYLALASMSFDKGVEKKCKNKGIAIVKQEGDMVVIVEDKLTTF
jgi:hypothetical protein